MTTVERSSTAIEVVLGVDTHLDSHVAVALDQLGRRLGDLTVPTTPDGYRTLVSWAVGFGSLRSAGIEGTGSYGAGLARHLKTKGVEVLEVERPKRRHLRRRGKSDPIDAEAAARAVLSGETAGQPKSGDGKVEMIRMLRAARCSAVKSRTQAANQLRNLVVTAPDGLRDRLRGLSTKVLATEAARFRPGERPSSPEEATKFALRSIARRYRALSQEITQLDSQLARLVAEAAPDLLALPAVSTNHAATLLVVAGDNPERLRSEASFASLCGVAPIPASSGKTVRYRLNRGGDRDANRALHLICVVRMRERRTREYVARRTAEGKSKREIMRCLKRYIAREIYRVVVPAAAASPPTAPSPGVASSGRSAVSS
jgi:transposase